MTVTATQIQDVLEALSTDRKQLIYVLAKDMLSAQQTENFDIYTLDDVESIQDARAEIFEGRGLRFSNPSDFKSHFGV